MEQKQILLSKIDKNAFNARDDYENEEFKQFVESIRVHGVLQPILVRPVGDRYEIVAGERRFVASQREKLRTIPAVVRKMTDEEAIEFMLIENIQRANLTELEEARGFKEYTQKFGEDSVGVLSDKITKSVGYIVRRIAVLDLPQDALELWENGKLHYGHMEQLIRLNDSEDLKTTLNDLKHELGFGKRITVKYLREKINAIAPKLKCARFSKKAAGCNRCQHNSTVQKQLFEVVETKAAQCMRPVCFQQNQRDWFSTRFLGSAQQKLYKTKAAALIIDIANQSTTIKHFTRTKPARRKCFNCQHFTSIYYLTGKIMYERTCLGEESCYREQTTSKHGLPQITPEQKDKAQERAIKLGNEARDKFYVEHIPPAIMRKWSLGNATTKRLLLAMLVVSNPSLHGWFARVSGFTGGMPQKGFRINSFSAFDVTGALAENVIDNMLTAAMCQIALDNHVSPDAREKIGDMLDIDLKSEWTLSREFLEKKTIAEILALGESIDLFNDQHVRDYKVKVLKMKTDNLGTLKKGDLIDLIVKSGMELKGKVPPEILKK